MSIELNELAQLLGIQTAYQDMAGKRRKASVESLMAVLGVLGVPVGESKNLKKVLADTRQQLRSQWIDPVIVAWSGQLPWIGLRLPRDKTGILECKLVLESGEIDAWTLEVDEIPITRVDEEGIITRKLTLPSLFPLGYHRLEVKLNRKRQECLIIAAPPRAYSPLNVEKQWGLFAPLYALRSERNWGCGDFGDMRDLMDWTAALGGKGMGTLPLLASFIDVPPHEPSPYAPASRLFWNEIYIDPFQIPELNETPSLRKKIDSGSFQRRIQSLQKVPNVPYREVMALKRPVLEELSALFFSRASERLDQFHHHVSKNIRLEDYARFRAVQDRRRTTWPTWSPRLREGQIHDRDYDANDFHYHLYVQWILHEQLTRLKVQSMSKDVKLYLDLPLGVNRVSYDVWRDGSVYAVNASVGAPPDPFFTKGQNWGFPPFHPIELRKRKYAPFIQFLRNHFQYAGLLRIDHVMGLHRLFWIPEGMEASEGVYVHYTARELYAILCLESQRHHCRLIGENLGTVPPYVNTSMARHGLRQMTVGQYTLKPDKNNPMGPLPTEALASINTHDMPTFSSFWKGNDIRDRQDLGLLKKKEMTAERKNRQALKNALIVFLKRHGFLKKDTSPAAVQKAWLSLFASGPSEFLLINLEDLWLEKSPQNTPGTMTERVNWRKKMKYSLEEIRRKQSLTRLLREIDDRRVMMVPNKKSEGGKRLPSMTTLEETHP